MGGLEGLGKVRERKHININKFSGLSRDWVGGKILFMSHNVFWGVIPYGRKSAKIKFPPKSRDNPVCVCVCYFFLCLFLIQKFRKGLADRGGWREEILQRPEIQASFLYPFPYAPLGEGGRISGELLGSFWVFICRQPPAANPFSKLDFSLLKIRRRFYSLKKKEGERRSSMI